MEAKIFKANFLRTFKKITKILSSLFKQVNSNFQKCTY